MATKFSNFRNEDVWALKDQNTRKTISRRTLAGILSRRSENYELKPLLNSKLLRAWSSPIDAIKPG